MKFSTVLSALFLSTVSVFAAPAELSENILDRENSGCLPL